MRVMPNYLRYGKNSTSIKSNRLKDKIALITGSASGIGAATAKEFAEEGATVIVSNIDEQPANHVVSVITENNCDAIFIRLDVTDESSWVNVYSKIDNMENCIY